MADELIKTKGSCYKITGTTDTSSTITEDHVYIRSVYWYGPSNAAHLVNLIDKEGGPIITMSGDSTGDSSPNSQQWHIEHTFEGIYCNDMDSGTLFIYVR